MTEPTLNWSYNCLQDSSTCSPITLGKMIFSYRLIPMGAIIDAAEVIFNRWLSVPYRTGSGRMHKSCISSQIDVDCCNQAKSSCSGSWAIISHHRAMNYFFVRQIYGYPFFFKKNHFLKVNKLVKLPIWNLYILVLASWEVGQYLVCSALHKLILWHISLRKLGDN